MVARRSEAKMLAAILSVVLALILISSGQASPPDGPSDPGLHAWFESLRQPQTHRSCCSMSDCRFANYRLNGSDYEVQIDGWNYTVPHEAILNTRNPTGRAVVCYTYRAFGTPLPQGVARTTPQDSIEILCFAPAGPTS